MRAKDDLKTIFDEICGPVNRWGTEFAGVLGMADVTWSMKREKIFVDEFMLLVSHGVADLTDFGLADLVHADPPNFPSLSLPSTRPSVSRKRPRSVSPSEPITLTAALPMSPPSAQSIPRPAWSKIFVGLHLESDLGKAALLELFASRAEPLAEHEHRRDPEEFDICLWEVASMASSKCTFESPLALLKNRSGLRAVHLGELFDHLDRCSHLPLPNTAAAQHRGEALAEV